MALKLRTGGSNQKGPEYLDLLLVYATVGDGKISFFHYVLGASLIVGGERFIENASPREIARWKEAIAKLQEMRLIQREKPRSEEYIMTYSGFEMADLAKRELDIDTSKDPKEYLNRVN